LRFALRFASLVLFIMVVRLPDFPQLDHPMLSGSRARTNHPPPMRSERIEGGKGGRFPALAHREFCPCRVCWRKPPRMAKICLSMSSLWIDARMPCPLGIGHSDGLNVS
jgi:hypothetical protein